MSGLHTLVVLWTLAGIIIVTHSEWHQTQVTMPYSTWFINHLRQSPSCHLQSSATTVCDGAMPQPSYTGKYFLVVNSGQTFDTVIFIAWVWNLSKNIIKSENVAHPDKTHQILDKIWINSYSHPANRCVLNQLVRFQQGFHQLWTDKQKFDGGREMTLYFQITSLIKTPVIGGDSTWLCLTLQNRHTHTKTIDGCRVTIRISNSCQINRNVC